MNMINSAAGVCRCSANAMYSSKTQAASLDLGSLRAFADWLSLASLGQMSGYPVSGALSPVKAYSATNSGYPSSWGVMYGNSLYANSMYGNSLYGSSLKNSLNMSAMGGNMLASPLTLSGLLRYSALSGFSD